MIQPSDIQALWHLGLFFGGMGFCGSPISQNGTGGTVRQVKASSRRECCPMRESAPCSGDKTIASEQQLISLLATGKCRR